MIDRKEKFINKCKEKFGDAFDYSEINYVDSKTKIKIRCKKHDYYFHQAPSEHLRGKKGCVYCTGKTKWTVDSFIQKAKEKHNNKYSYSKIYKVDTVNKLTINCPLHGDFEQLLHNHLKGQGCPMCGTIKTSSENKYSTDDFIAKATDKHDGKYNYSKVNYIDSKTKVTIVCNEHGEFKQQPYNHLRGKGCPKCGDNKVKLKLTYTVDDFIDKAKEVHEDKYDYSKVQYKDIRNKVLINCPIHGDFEQSPYIHINGHGCTKCSSSVSNQELEINEYLKSLNLETITSSKSIIPPYQIDIYIPSHKLAIEFNGLYWHSELHKDNNYHIDKTKACESNGIQLIHIFEDEWLDKQNIVKSRLKNLLGLTENRIYARKCEVKEVPYKNKVKFLNENHIQGDTVSKTNIGLYYNDELISIMTFGNSRLIMNGNKNDIELLRFCSKLDTNVIGSFSKLLKHFIKNNNGKNIISYADKRWSQGSVYEKNGFDIISESKPNYWYVIGKARKHRFNFRKDVLVREGFDSKLTEHQIMLNRGIYRIYDCGTIKYKKSLE